MCDQTEWSQDTGVGEEEVSKGKPEVREEGPGQGPQWASLLDKGS